MELRVFLKQYVAIDTITRQQYYWNGNNPWSLQKQYGSLLPASRRWPKYSSFEDYTSSASNLDELQLSWEIDADRDGNTVAGDTFARKATNGTIIFEGDAYRDLKKWLIDDVSAPYNVVCVQITHVGCGNYVDWVIKSTDIEYCKGDICQMAVSLKQKDESYVCIAQTLIADNWQGWFPDNKRTPANGKKHPRFSYCNEIRPNGLLISIWWMMAQLSSIFFLFVISFLPVYNGVVVPVVNGIGFILQKVVNFANGLGANITWTFNKLSPVNGQDIKDVVGNFFVESAGCGREHPAPRIADYIQNVCDKCGVTVNAQTAGLFFSTTITLETSGNRQRKETPQPMFNPHYNACYWNGVRARGIRRYHSLSIFQGANKNTTDWWIPENRPNLTLDMFLDELKGVYNLDWRLIDNKLMIARKDSFKNDTPVFDLQDNAPDRNLIVEDFCFKWNGETVPSFLKGIYGADGADVCGNEVLGQMNGIVQFGTYLDSPRYGKMKDATVQFGGTKFRLDGASTDYVFDAMQQVLNTQFIGTAPWLPIMMRDIYNQYISEFADYALVLKQETATLPKILLWDGQSYMNAKCYKPFAAHPNAAALAPQPTPNGKYNNTPVVQQWAVKHPPLTFVSGSTLTGAVKRGGYYTVAPLAGRAIADLPAMLVNYPMYFNPQFEGNLWDWFHWIDDPNVNDKIGLEWRVKLEMCCDVLKRLEVFNNAGKLKIGSPIQFTYGYFREGKITQIILHYNPSDPLGMYVELKGQA